MAGLVQLLDQISNRQLFSSITSQEFRNGNGVIKYQTPIWFNFKSFQTMWTWIVSYLEKNISQCYQSGQANGCNSSHKRKTFEDINIRLESNLKLQQQLKEFWNRLESPKQQEFIHQGLLIYADLSENASHYPDIAQWLDLIRKFENKNMANS